MPSRWGVGCFAFDLANGKSVRSSIADNTLSIELSADPIRATWTNPDKTTRTQTDLVMRDSKVE